MNQNPPSSSPLIVNRSFMLDFVDAEPPCFALGMVQEGKEAVGLLALRAGIALPSDVTRGGIRFGHQLHGGDDFEVIYFAFEFYGLGRYYTLVNPNDPLVRPVLTRMLDRGEYFVLCHRSRQPGHRLPRGDRAGGIGRTS